MAGGGANSGTATAVAEDHQPIHEESACGLLRMEAKLWLLASETVFANKEEEEEFCRSAMPLPDLGKGCGSIFVRISTS